MPAGQKGTATAPARPGNPNKVLMWKDDRSNGTVTDNKAKISNGTTKQGVEAIESSNFDNICGLPMFWYVSPEVSLYLCVESVPLANGVISGTAIGRL